MMMWSILRAFIVLIFPLLVNENADDNEHQLCENYMDNILQHEEQNHLDGDEARPMAMGHVFQQDINSGLKLSFSLNSVDYQATTEFQNLTILSTKQFGKAIVIDGHLQSTEFDEYIYHESLVHPALLTHNDQPETIFIMGGGGGSAAREALKYKDMQKVIVCDIDKDVFNLILKHMPTNYETFNDKRLQIVFNDAKDELKKSQEKFDVILGDVPDLYKSRPSNNLYTKSFYENVVKPKLKEHGLFVTQAGPAGILTHKVVFSPLYNTLKKVFTYVIAYTVHVPSYGDSRGWVMASNKPINLNVAQLNKRISERIKGELSYLDGPIIAASTVLNKTLKKSLMEETRILTEANVNVRFLQQREVRNDA